jgi:predicted membrane chloride channel (bestrophin family)
MSEPSSEQTQLNYGRQATVSYGLLNDEEKGLTEYDGVVGTYDINAFVTMRVFGVTKGTILVNWVLWKETLSLAVIFWGIFCCFMMERPDNFRKLVGKESSIRAFLAMFSTLIGLLLSFYTALNLGRWWQMRTAVNDIQGATKMLTMLVSQLTQDPTILASINRYGRTSLFLIFATSQNEEGEATPLRKAFKKGLLSKDDLDKLVKLVPHMPFVQAETLWAWLANLVTRLNDQGLTKGPPHYCQLLGAVEKGRAAIENIQTYLETPIPLAYVHLLCLMVKLHNIILTILMSMACVMVSGGAKGFQPVSVFRTAFRAFFMPFLYNAILILNSEVTDPFGGDEGDFEWSNYDVNMAVSGKAFAEAVEHKPNWIKGMEGAK